MFYNSLPNHLHAEWTIKALRAGKHVLCEKPIALTFAEMDAMIAISKEAGKILMEAFMYRHRPQTLKVKEIIESGVLGKLPSRSRIEIVGTQGTLNILNPFKPNREDVIELQRRDKSEVIKIKGQELYLGKVDDMCNAILLGKTPCVSLVDSRANTLPFLCYLSLRVWANLLLFDFSRFIV
ncbi:MAG: Gfo/Idh/MocA family oxidoreductase [Anaerolineales bacterium]|nr:Gfo/Idh/MocA family oxidoreductase [Anaerolineales bacterium]